MCAGAIGSPQLLMLSGIGPAGAPARRSASTRSPTCPGSGDNLQDHPVAMACYAPAAPLPASRYNHGEVYAALRSPAGRRLARRAAVSRSCCPSRRPAARPRPGGFALMASVVAPDSRGTVRLASADPAAAPLIDPGFLREPADLDRLAAGLAVIRAAAAGAAFTAARRDRGAARPRCPRPRRPAGLDQAHGRQLLPPGRHLPDRHRARMTARSSTRTCASTGSAGLRVADASVMPVIPNAPLHATVLAIAERAADLIAGRQAAAARNPRAASSDR